MKIISIVGARPQFIKLAPICRVLERYKNSIRHVIIHTGQHYDYNMSKIFFHQLGIPAPKYHLNVGSSGHGEQTGEMLRRIEPIIMREAPDWVMVFGDTNSTLAGALAASKLHIPVAHVEAGLRSFNKKMPEEINRVFVDHCATLLFCPTLTAINNLRKERMPAALKNGQLVSLSSPVSFQPTISRPCLVNVGDIMVDTIKLGAHIAQKKSQILKKLALPTGGYFLSTIHRAENTDCRQNLKTILLTLAEISRDAPVILPLHPRTRKLLPQLKIDAQLRRIKIMDPIGYFDMILLEQHARMILTDSGGIQKEAFILGVPCITLRNETEWVETVQLGKNIVTGACRLKILNALKKLNKKSWQRPAILKHSVFGDGNAAQRIVRILQSAAKPKD